MGTILAANESLSFGFFKGSSKRIETPRMTRCFTSRSLPIAKLFDFREKVVMKKRQLVCAVLCVYRAASPLIFLRIRAIHEKKKQHNTEKS